MTSFEHTFSNIFRGGGGGGGMIQMFQSTNSLSHRGFETVWSNWTLVERWITDTCNTIHNSQDIWLVVYLYMHVMTDAAQDSAAFTQAIGAVWDNKAKLVGLVGDEVISLWSIYLSGTHNENQAK